MQSIQNGHIPIHVSCSLNIDNKQNTDTKYAILQYCNIDAILILNTDNMQN